MQRINVRWLRKSIARLGLTESLEAVEILQLCQEWLAREIGLAGAKDIQWKWVRHRTIGVKADNSVVRMLIKNKEAELLVYLKSKGYLLRRVRFLL